jgi:hypothetical protein
MHFKTSKRNNFNRFKNQANLMATKYGITNWFKTKLIKIKKQFFDKVVLRSARSEAGNFKDISKELLIW